MSDSKKITFAVVGCGHIGKRHIMEIRANQNAELIAVCDVKAQSEFEDFGLPFFGSLDALLLSDLCPDVINICTPNGLHTSQSLMVLEQSNVLVEKPIALSVEDANALIVKEKETENQLFCVMQNRYSPPALWLKSLMNNNILGEIYMVNLNCFWNRDDSYYNSANWRGTMDLDGRTLFTQFSHFVDIMYWLFGDISNIRSRMANYTHKNSTEFDDSGIVSFDFVSGGMGSINFTTSIYGANMESSIAIIGEKGSVKVSGQYMDQVSYCLIEDYEMPDLPPANPPNDYGDYKGSAANHHYVIENVIDVLKGRSTISTNALEGMKVVEMIERIYQEA